MALLKAESLLRYPRHVQDWCENAVLLSLLKAGSLLRCLRLDRDVGRSIAAMHHLLKAESLLRYPRPIMELVKGSERSPQTIGLKSQRSVQCNPSIPLKAPRKRKRLFLGSTPKREQATE